MPSRKIPKSYRNVTGKVAINGGKRSVHFESPLEKDFFVLVDYDREVKEVEEQPVKITYQDPDGNARTYCPDALLHFRSEVNRRPMLCEIKSREELQDRWLELKPRFKAATKFARERGWRFKIITDREIRTEFLENVRLVREYRGYPFDDLQWQRMKRSLRSGGMSISAVLGDLCASRSEQAGLLAQIWGHIGSGRLVADLETKLGYHTMVGLAEYSQ